MHFQVIVTPEAVKMFIFKFNFQIQKWRKKASVSWLWRTSADKTAVNAFMETQDSVKQLRLVLKTLHFKNFSTRKFGILKTTIIILVCIFSKQIINNLALSINIWVKEQRTLPTLPLCIDLKPQPQTKPILHQLSLESAQPMSFLPVPSLSMFKT